MHIFFFLPLMFIFILLLIYFVYSIPHLGGLPYSTTECDDLPNLLADSAGIL